MKCTIVLLLLTLLHVHGSYRSNKQLIKENQEVAKEPRFLKLTRPDVKCDCPPECLASWGEWACCPFCGWVCCNEYGQDYCAETVEECPDYPELPQMAKQQRTNIVAESVPHWQELECEVD